MFCGGAGFCLVGGILVLGLRSGIPWRGGVFEYIGVRWVSLCSFMFVNPCEVGEKRVVWFDARTKNKNKKTGK